jgi:hypothetical protein
MLKSLQTGFTSNLSLIDANLKEVQASQYTVNRFLDLTSESAEEITPDERYSTLVAIWRPRTLDLNNNLLLVILDSEALKTLGNPVLQEAIARWRDSVEELNELKAQLADSQHEILLTLGRYPEFWPVLSQDPANKPSVNGEMMNKIRSDQYFMALTARKSYSIRAHIRVMLEVREGTESVLGLLDSALADIS